MIEDEAEGEDVEDSDYFDDEEDISRQRIATSLGCLALARGCSETGFTRYETACRRRCRFVDLMGRVLFNPR